MFLAIFLSFSNTVKIGEFTIQKGKNSSASSSSDKWEEKAEKELNELIGRFNYYKANG